jgi:hypothetical protein
MEGYCSTDQSPQRAVVPMEEEEVRTEVHFRPQVKCGLHCATFYKTQSHSSFMCICCAECNKNRKNKTGNYQSFLFTD